MHVDKWVGTQAVTINEILKVLNEAIARDRAAMEKLIEQRVDCSKAMGDHPSIQVSSYDHKTGKPNPEKLRVGLLGILNGIIGTDRNIYGPLSAHYSDDGKLMEFMLTDTDALTKKKEGDHPKRM